MLISAEIFLILCFPAWFDTVAGFATYRQKFHAHGERVKSLHATYRQKFHAHGERVNSLHATTADSEMTGFFRLPESSRIEGPLRPIDMVLYNEFDEIERSVVIDNPTLERLYRQLLFAFDNYQESEIKQMTSMILKMPFQLSKLLQLMRIAEGIERTAEQNGGFDEYMYDALRTVRSQMRMYGKDAELGEDYQVASGKSRFIWPWERA